MRLSQRWSAAVPVFDDAGLVSYAGLVPVMGLAQSVGLHDLVGERVDLGRTRIRSAGANPAGKVAAIVAGMAAGADSIDDLDTVRSGGMPVVFTGTYAAATLGQFLREFTHGHVRQLQAVARRLLAGLVQRSPVLPGLDGGRVFVDIDSLLRPVYGHQKVGASFGHTKIGGKALLRRGLSPLATTVSTPGSAPLIAGIRLRAGRAGSSKGAASMVTETITTVRAAGATGTILVRGDAAYGNSEVAAACVRAGVEFSLVIARRRDVLAAIASIPDDAWTPVRYPGAVIDPDTGEWISDAHVAEVPEFAAFTSTDHPVTARLVVRRVKALSEEPELFPAFRFHPFITNSTEPAPAADVTHRQHAVIETTFADLVDGPLAHLPSGRFNANAAWAVLAGITHNLLRAAGALASPAHAVARGATLRRHLVAVPARHTRPQGRRTLHLPAHWPWANAWTRMWHNVFHPGIGPPAT